MGDRVLQVGVRDDLIIVREIRTLFYAIFAKLPNQPRLVLIRRRPTKNTEIVARATAAAKAKARELGWLRKIQKLKPHASITLLRPRA
jgi:hypothetical protein